MSYWSWLRESLKPMSFWTGMKLWSKDTMTEWMIGYVGIILSLGIGVGYTVGTRDARYLLLLLATIAFFLLATHAQYRVNKKR